MRKSFNEGFLFLYDWMPAVKSLSGDDLKELVLALFDFQRDGKELPEFSNSLTGVFAAMILPTIERRLKAKSIREKSLASAREASAKSSGRASSASVGGKASPVSDNGRTASSDGGDTDSSSSANVGGTDCATVGASASAEYCTAAAAASIAEHSIAEHSIAEKSRAKKSEEESTSPRKAPQGADTCVRGGESDGGEDGFSRFWSAYPRKVGKAAAKRAFEKLRPGEELIRTMLSAIDRQKSCDQWRRESGKFIPNPSTWLCGRRWEDETSAPYSRMCTEYDSPSSWDDIF